MIIKRVQISDAEHTMACADVEITNGLISKITPCLDGMATSVLIPGFIDIHIHGYGGDDVMDSAAAVARVSVGLKKQGVTGFMPTVMTAPLPRLKAALSDVASAKYEGARFLGIHLEGPFISMQKKGAHDAHCILKPSLALINELIEAAQHKISVMTVAPEIFDEATFKALASKKISLSLGHSAAQAYEARQAFRAGAEACTHFWNAMSGIENRKQGLAFAGLTTPGVYAELISDLFHVDPETMRYTIRAFTPGRIIAVTDALKVTGTPDGESVSGGLAIEKQGVKIVVKGTETIAGSAAVMFDNFHNLLALGYTLNEVVAMTSTNAARRFHLPSGVIKVGAPADLIVLSSDLKTIEHVYVGGK